MLGVMNRLVAISTLVLLSTLLLAASSCKKHGRLERDDQLICDANNAGTLLPSKLILDEEQAREWGSAFEASGNCDATISNPEFRSPLVALVAGGNSHLVIEGGILEGGKHAIVVSGNATVEIRGTVVLGKIKKSGHGKVIGMDTAKRSEDESEDKAGEDKAGEDKAIEAKTGKAKARKAKARKAREATK